MATLYETARPWNLVIAAVLFVLSVVVVLLSPHETSKIAILAGTAAFALAWWSLPWARRLASVTWILACLVVLPLVVLAYKGQLHEASWLQASARQRIMIWHHTAKRTMNQPLIGIGAEMTYVVGQQEDLHSTADDELISELSRHAHNLYLQTWFELGLIGAMLLTWAGLAVLRGIGRLDPRVQVFAYATFASAATISASSYGMWQTWFIAMFGLSAIAVTVGRRWLQTAPGEPSRSFTD